MFDNKLNERDSLDGASPANRRFWAIGIIVFVAPHVAIAVTFVVRGLALAVRGLGKGDSAVVRNANLMPPVPAGALRP